MDDQSIESRQVSMELKDVYVQSVFKKLLYREL